MTQSPWSHEQGVLRVSLVLVASVLLLIALLLLAAQWVWLDLRLSAYVDHTTIAGELPCRGLT